MNIGICVIAYNRLVSLKRLLFSLSQAKYSHYVSLIISIDKSETAEVENYARHFEWSYGDKRILTYPKNLGLRKHVLECGKLLDEFDALVVLEDDLYVAENFYLYARACVEKFYNDRNIAGISLYNFPINYHCMKPFTPLCIDSDVYMMQNAQSWGQVWLKKQWHDFMEWYKLNCIDFKMESHLPRSICSWPKSSWLKYHTKYCIETNKYFVYPYVSLSTCFSEVGVHVNGATTLFQTPILYGLKYNYDLSKSIKYDAFFENESLYGILQIDKKELCLDYFGEKKNRMKQRFWLTRDFLPYKVIKSYGLQLKPYEMNIIMNIPGNELFLYDTFYTAKPPVICKKNQKLWDFYVYGIHIDLVSTVIRYLKIKVLPYYLFYKKMKSKVK